jgi:hypothetical protein
MLLSSHSNGDSLSFRPIDILLGLAAEVRKDRLDIGCKVQDYGGAGLVAATVFVKLVTSEPLVSRRGEKGSGLNPQENALMIPCDFMEL